MIMLYSLLIKCLRYPTHYSIIDTQVPRGSWKYVHQGGLNHRVTIINRVEQIFTPNPKF